jgi:hypothetical protein
MQPFMDFAGRGLGGGERRAQLLDLGAHRLEAAAGPRPREIAFELLDQLRYGVEVNRRWCGGTVLRAHRLLVGRGRKSKSAADAGPDRPA